jgi:thiol:disulfide interchange protein
MKTLLHPWRIAIAAWVGGVAAAKDAELLDPEAAFRFSAQLVDSGTIEVRYAIANGYYQYRDKFHFQLTPGEGKPEPSSILRARSSTTHLSEKWKPAVSL